MALQIIQIKIFSDQIIFVSYFSLATKIFEYTSITDTASMIGMHFIISVLCLHISLKSDEYSPIKQLTYIEIHTGLITFKKNMLKYIFYFLRHL